MNVESALRLSKLPTSFQSLHGMSADCPVEDSLTDEVADEARSPDHDLRVGQVNNSKHGFSWGHHPVKAITLPPRLGSGVGKPPLPYASPLMPLQQRDRTILAGLFDREDIGDITRDITLQLSKLVPEPCWDDNPYDFLRDFL